MCHRPCFGTPEDIEKIIEAGFGDRLCLEDNCGLTEGSHLAILTPALKGGESKRSPATPWSEAGCTFWKHGKCELHNKGLKPTSGKLAHHAMKKGDDPWSCSDYVAETWNSDKGRALAKSWCEERGVLMGPVEMTFKDCLEIIKQSMAIGTLDPEEAREMVCNLVKEMSGHLSKDLKGWLERFEASEPDLKA
jgi:hypothetical protein